MNIPTKVLRSTYINNETYFHHQSLAKRFYKSSGKNVKKYNKTLFSNDFDFRSTEFYDQVSYCIGESKQNYKEEIFKWYNIFWDKTKFFFGFKEFFCL